MCKTYSKFQVGDCGRQEIDFLIEFRTKSDMGDRWDGGDWLIETYSKFQMSEGRGKGNNGVIKCYITKIIHEYVIYCIFFFLENRIIEKF